MVQTILVLRTGAAGENTSSREMAVDRSEMVFTALSSAYAGLMSVEPVRAIFLNTPGATVMPKDGITT